MNGSGGSYNLPCELFFKSFGKQVALRAKSYEDEAVWLDRVKRRRKWRQDCWHTLLDFFLTILKAPFWFCLRILFPVIGIMAILFVCIFMLSMVTFTGFEFIAESCFQNDYGITVIQGRQSKFDDALEPFRCFVLIQFYKLQRYITKGDLCQMSFISNSVEQRVKEMHAKSDRNDDDDEPGVCLTGAPGGPRRV